MRRESGENHQGTSRSGKAGYIGCKHSFVEISKKSLQVEVESIYNFIDESGQTFTHTIAQPLFTGTDFFNHNPLQQDGGNDCGYWATYNAIMFVCTGNGDFLAQFTSRSRKPASFLRYIFYDLILQYDFNNSGLLKNMATTNTQPMLHPAGLI